MREEEEPICLHRAYTDGSALAGAVIERWGRCLVEQVQAVEAAF